MTLNQRDAVNFVGLCWKNGKPHVNEGADAALHRPREAVPYHNLGALSAPRPRRAGCCWGLFQQFQPPRGAVAVGLALGAHLKAFLTFWPHMTLEADKGAGKTT